MMSQVVSDNFQMFRMLEKQTGLYLPEKVYPVFHSILRIKNHSI